MPLGSPPHDELRITVLGETRPAGSKRAFATRRNGELTGRVAVVDANPNAQGWKQEVGWAARQAMVAAGLHAPLTGPLTVEMTFYRCRPASHYGTGRNVGNLRPSAPVAPVVRPDVLKLARGTEDALTGIVYGDDAQTVDLHLFKRYGIPERCEIIVRPSLVRGASSWRACRPRDEPAGRRS